jgi:fluoroacetyl-CoA thioesterase
VGAEGPQAGAVGRVEAVVDDAMTAAAVGSGLVKGLATPTMIGLMEGAAVAAVADALPPGTSSVGTRVDVRHLAPTPVGMKVVAEARLTEVDRRRLTFEVSVADEKGMVGQGIHERYIIDSARFAESMAQRAAEESASTEDQ